MAQRCAKVGAFDQLEGQIVGAVGDAEVEHARDVPVMEERRHARLSAKHLDEVRVVGEGGQDSLEANALLEAARAASNRDEGLGHTADAEAFDQFVVTEVLGGRGGHERSKIAYGDAGAPRRSTWPASSVLVRAV